MVPEDNLQARDPDSVHAAHSAGKCLVQLPPPAFWQNFNTSNVGRQTELPDADAQDDS